MAKFWLSFRFLQVFFSSSGSNILAGTRDKRKHPRLVHRASVLVTYSSGQSEPLQMHDFSETGMFIQCSNANLPRVGELLQVQTLEIEDAPMLSVKVMRTETGQGFAVEFVQ
ncbi:MAG: PilZ domain-containing protein [Gammaproteobacteria bacterium]